MIDNVMHILIKMHLQQLSRSIGKEGRLRLVWFLSMLWLMQGCVIYYIKQNKIPPEMMDALAEHPAIAIAAICASALIMDFLFKMLFKHDSTVMDAFLKTRPIRKDTWERFLLIAQLWHPFNLMLPMLCVVGCFMLFPFGLGLSLLLSLFAISVANGILVMLIKRGGRYDETKVKAHGRLQNWIDAAMQGARVRNRYVSSIQYISLLRVPRLLVEANFAWIAMFLLVWLQSHDGEFFWGHNFCIVGLFVCHSIFIGRYGLCIESSFFDGIWTKPLSFSHLLSDKYKTFGIITLPLVLPCIFLIPEEWVSWSRFLAFAIYGSGFGNMVMLTGAYNRSQFNLFAKAFYGIYNRDSYYHGYEYVIALVVFTLAIGLTFLPQPWMCDVALISIGATSFLLHKQYFKWVERLFYRNRYKHIEKYR